MNSSSTPNIWQLQSQGDIAGIIQAIDSPELKVRRRAITALRALDAKEAIPKLQTLYDAEVSPQSRELVEAAIEHLTRDAPHLDPGLAERAERKQELLSALASDDPEVIIGAVEHLGKSSGKKDRSVIEPIVLIFRNPIYPASVRLAAAEVLLTLESALTSISLLGALRKSEWQVRRNAAEVLGQVKADWCVQPLAEIMKNDPNEGVRKAAADALAKIDNLEARQLLKNRS